MERGTSKGWEGEGGGRGNCRRGDEDGISLIDRWVIVMQHKGRIWNPLTFQSSYNSRDTVPRHSSIVFRFGTYSRDYFSSLVHRRQEKNHQLWRKDKDYCNGMIVYLDRERKKRGWADIWMDEERRMRMEKMERTIIVETRGRILLLKWNDRDERKEIFEEGQWIHNGKEGGVTLDSTQFTKREVSHLVTYHFNRLELRSPIHCKN